MLMMPSSCPSISTSGPNCFIFHSVVINSRVYSLFLCYIVYYLSSWTFCLWQGNVNSWPSSCMSSNDSIILWEFHNKLMSILVTTNSVQKILWLFLMRSSWELRSLWLIYQWTCYVQLDWSVWFFMDWNGVPNPFYTAAPLRILKNRCPPLSTCCKK